MSTIKVNPKAAPTFRPNSARGKVWAFISTCNGKSVESVEKAWLAKPPSTPQKGKLAGKVEPLAGWLNFFAKQQLIEIK